SPARPVERGAAAGGLPDPTSPGLRAGGRARAMRASRSGALAAVAVLLAGVACGTQASPGRPTPTPTARAATAGGESPSPPACSTRVFARMSEEQRVGQLILLGLGGDALGQAEADAIRAHP